MSKPPARTTRRGLLTVVPGSAGTDRARDRHRAHRGDGDTGAGVRGVHDLAVADVHADVADRAVVEHQVARLQRADRDGVPEPICAPDECGSETPACDQAAIVRPLAVEGVGTCRAVDVGVADLRHRVGDGRRGSAGDRRWGRGRRPGRRRRPGRGRCGWLAPRRERPQRGVRLVQGRLEVAAGGDRSAGSAC